MWRMGLCLLWAVCICSFAQIHEQDIVLQEKLQPEVRLFRIGSADVGGFYDLSATMMAEWISRPPQALPCQHEKECGMDAGIVGVNVATQGSRDNVRKLIAGELDSALVQSDVAFAAYSGDKREFAQNPERFQSLRAIASLYSEVLHVIVRADSGIEHISDLRGHKVSMGASNSGTVSNVADMLAAYEVGADFFEGVNLSVSEGLSALKRGEVDAVFAISAYPNRMITKAFSDPEQTLRLVSLDKAVETQMLRRDLYLKEALIPTASYPKQDKDVRSIAVRALWLTTTDQDADLIYDLTKRFWNKGAEALQQKLKSPELLPQLQHGLDAIGIPLHEGAKRYYNEIGKRF